MALFVSVQSGNWHDPATWNLGAVPDLGADDVIIDTGHEVVLEPNQYISMWGGHLLAVTEGATFRIQGGLDIAESSVWLGGTIVGEGGHLAIWSGTDMSIQSTGTLEITTNFYLESAATMTVEGQFTVATGAYAYVYFDGVLTIEPGATLQTYGSCYIEWNAQAIIRDDFSVEDGGVLDIFGGSTVDIASSGAVFVLGTLSLSSNGRCEVFGYLGVHQDGFLRVYSGGLINVYKDISVSGQLTGGGKIVMLRREGRILDYNDNTVFVLDRAYGVKPTRIA